MTEKNVSRLSTWREESLELSPQVVTTYVFPDTKPNHYHINSLGAGELYFGVDLIPDVNKYDMIIPAYGENFYARETGKTQIRIYNASTNPVIIKLTTFEHDFDPSSIKPSSTGGSTGGTIDSTSIDFPDAFSINGFNVPLPSGNNNIGRVIVSEMPEQTINFSALPYGDNHIGRVTVDSTAPIPEGDRHIGRVSVSGGVTISSMPPVTVENPDNEIRQSHYSYNESIGTTVVSLDFGTVGVNRFTFISNDGDTDLLITFDDVLPSFTNPPSGADGMITLRAGETISNVNRKANTIHLLRLSGDGNTRIMGV